ncbi:hypothetical protein [Brevibacillus borstelensis]|uniref:hypothetical protein n=1 Tax=Brevibacillus borstelensis TaxID=45462 RepID=UPI0030BEF92E
MLICVKGDEVKMKSGEIGVVTDTWGIARNWCKLKMSDGSIVITMTENIDSIIRCNHLKRTGRKQ